MFGDYMNWEYYKCCVVILYINSLVCLWHDNSTAKAFYGKTGLCIFYGRIGLRVVVAERHMPAIDRVVTTDTLSSGPSQKADRARPGTPGLPDFHPPGSPWGVPGQVRHKRQTGPGPAPPTALTEPGVRELCVFGEGGRRKSHEWEV
jgi:hypothetical protein